MRSQKNMKSRATRGARNGSDHPPEFVPTRVVRCKYRFKATAASTSDQLTMASFGDLLCVATGAAAAYQLGNFVRLRKIEIWGPMASDLVPVTVSVEWNGTSAGLYGKSVIHSDTSMGSSRPAHVSTRPPEGSQLSQWLRCNVNSNCCLLKYPANAIVDVSYELVVRDDAAVDAVTGAVAGATTGAIYVRALNSPVNNNLVPLSVATI